MIRYIRDLRLIPIALIASACLLALKLADIAFHGSALFSSGAGSAVNGDVAVTHPILDATAPAGSKLSWAQEMFNFPNSSGVTPQSSASIAPATPPPNADRDNFDITGSVTTEPAAGNAATAPSDKAAAGAPPGKVAKAQSAAGTVIPTDGAALPTGAERAILERLQQRRQELDNRAHELDVREDLIKSAEKRMDAKIDELKQVEAQIKQATQDKSDAEKARLKSLVTMYENMKPRDAAKIFNGLDPNVLLEVAGEINPRTMADIVAQMSADVAQRLTVELAEKAAQQNKSTEASAAALPKIEGQPMTQ